MGILCLRSVSIGKCQWSITLTDDISFMSENIADIFYKQLCPDKKSNQNRKRRYIYILINRICSFCDNKFKLIYKKEVYLNRSECMPKTETIKDLEGRMEIIKNK